MHRFVVVFSLLALIFLTGSGIAAPWTGNITISDDPSNPGHSLTVNAYIPDTSKPVRAAMIMAWAYDDPNWRTVAGEFNCLMISTTLNYYQATTDGKKVVALLNAASVQFPSHPEIQYTAVILHGWSQASAGGCWTAAQPELTNRIAAVVNIHETDGLPYQPPLSVPILFIAGWPDGYSKLANTNGIVLNRASLGAPYTMVNDVGHDHIDVGGNYGYTRVWLEEVLKRRLPVVAPATANVVLPSWQNDSSAWLGAYGYKETSGVWAGQTLTNVVIASRANWAALGDSRQPIWFPSEWAARVWKVYSQTTRLPDYTAPLPSGTDPTPKPAETAAPVFTFQPTNGAVVGTGGTSSQPYSFQSAVTSATPVIFRWYRIGTSNAISSGANCYNSSTTAADAGASFYVVATNEFGSTTSSTVTLTLNSSTAAPMLMRRYDMLVEPLDTQSTAGSTATFSVWAQGTPAPTYQWYKNGVAIAGATSASYTTPALTVADNGATYYIVATNSAGSATSRSATLAVGAAAAPGITAQPQNVTVYAGQPATFSVSATGAPSPTYQWQKNGVNISGATLSQYTVPSAAAGDNGATFGVMVTNASGSVTSTAATLTVNTSATAPVITTQPAATTVAAGQPATFTVAATGNPALTYQWYKNNTVLAASPIAGATSATYTLPVAGYGENGTFYYVVVSNTAGSVNSSPAVLTVNSAPAITTQPSNAVVTIGSTAAFSVTATGNALTFKWYKNGVLISGATSASYTTPATVASDDGAVYTVVVSNSLGSATSIPVTLTVNVASASLSFSTQPSNVTADLGSAATFTAAASGAAPTYQWYKNGVAISGATASSYTTPPVSAGDNGALFTVVATNSAGKVTSTAAVLSVRSAAPVFQADFNGSGNGVGGSTDMVLTGGNGAPVTGTYYWNSVIGTSPLAAGAGNYFECLAINPGGVQSGAKFTPATSANSLAALVSGSVNSGGKTYIALNGGYDVFARLNRADPTSNMAGIWFSQFDLNAISGTKGMRLIFNGQGGGNPRLQISTGNALAILNYTRTYGTAGTASTGSAQTVYADGPTGYLTSAGTFHMAFTFSTDAAGLITVKLFGRKDASAIDTSSTADLFYAATFQIDASVVGANPIGTGAWNTINWVGVSGLDTCFDFDTIRLYNTAPSAFPALGAPAVSVQPLSLTVASGQTATFSVTASGATAYQWYKNGVAISGATSASYTTPAVAGVDNGASYYVVASNSSGSVTSGAAVLAVSISASDLSITSQPQNITVYTGQTAAFAVSGMGSSAISYQWRKNGVPITGATSATYTTPALTMADTGAAYNVVLTNAAGNITSNAATVTVYAIPVFEAQFNGSSNGIGGIADVVLRGGTGSLGTASGMSSSIVSSPSMGQGNCARITTTTSTGFQIAAANFSPSAGAGWDVVTGTVTSGGTAYTTLNGGFDVFVRPNNSPSGDQMWFRPVDFDCRSGNSGLRIIVNGAGNSLVFELASNSSSAFGATAGTWNASNKSVLGQFILGAGIVNHVAVTFTTSATGQITAKLFAVASDAAIDTSSSANLLGSISFYANASVIGSNALTGGNWSMVERESTWMVTSVDYDCVRLYNTDPKIFPAISVLPYGVSVAPSIVTTPQSQTVTAGQTATFSVTAIGTPAPGYQWQKNGVDISGASSASYTTPVTTPADEGALFRVVVSNIAGSATSNPATLTVTNSYASWKNLYFTSGQQADVAISGATANPSGDGISNLLKYAYGIDPASCGAAHIPRINVATVSGSGYLQLSFRKQKNAPDLNYIVQVSDDLMTWTSTASETEQVSQSDNGDGTYEVIVQDLSPISAKGRRFMRLRVDQQ